MKKIALTILLCGFISTPTFAAKFSPAYVEAGLGKANYEFQTSPSDFRLAAGLRVNSNWAVEIGGSSLGGSSGLGIKPVNKTTVKTLQLAVVGNSAVNSEFDWVGKLGVTRNKSSQTGVGNIAGVTDLYFAVGGDYHINSSISVRGLYENFGTIGSKVGGGTVNADAFTLNLQYNF